MPQYLKFGTSPTVYQYDEATKELKPFVGSWNASDWEKYTGFSNWGGITHFKNVSLEDFLKTSGAKIGGEITKPQSTTTSSIPFGSTPLNQPIIGSQTFADILKESQPQLSPSLTPIATTTPAVPEKTPIDILQEALTRAQAKAEEYKSKWEQTQDELEKTIKAWQAEIKRISENPWLTEDQKNEEQEKINKKYGDLIVDTSTQFLTAFPEASPQIQKQLQDMARAGFSYDEINKIATKITQQALIPYQSYIKQFATRYLQPIYEKQYMETLEPLTKFVEEQRKALEQIPQLWKEYYYGGEDKKGYIQQLKEEAELKKKQLEEQIENEKTDLKNFFDLSKQYLQADLDRQLATLEEQKTGAQRYLTGYLAKLGALNTSGQAINAIATLNAKYDRQISDVKTKYNLMLQQKELTYLQQLRRLDEKLEEAKAKISSDVSKTEQEIAEKLFDLETKIIEKKSSLVSKWIDKYIDTQRTAIKEAKAYTADYIKDWFNYASTQYQTQLLENVLPILTDTKKEEQDLKILKLKLQVKAISNTVGTTGMASKPTTTEWALEKGVYGLSPKEIADIQNLKNPPLWFAQRLSQEEGVSYLPTSPYVKKKWEEAKIKLQGYTIPPAKLLPPDIQAFINRVQEKINTGEMSIEKAQIEFPALAPYFKPRGSATSLDILGISSPALKETLSKTEEKEKGKSWYERILDLFE